MAKEFQPAPEVAEIARELIDLYHSHLGPVRIEYVFILEAPKVNGKLVWARAKKIGGLNAWLAQENQKELTEPEEFFVIEVVKPIWQQLDEKARKALTDHELTHCWVDEKGKLSIHPHDLEEFNSIVRRWGLWRDDVQLFFEAGADYRQEKLRFEQSPIKLILPAVAREINLGALDGDGVTVTAEVRAGN